MSASPVRRPASPTQRLSSSPSPQKLSMADENGPEGTNAGVGSPLPARARVARTYERKAVVPTAPEQTGAATEEVPRAQPSVPNNDDGGMDKGLARLLDLPDDVFATRREEDVAPTTALFAGSDYDDKAGDSREEVDADSQDESSALARAAEPPTDIALVTTGLRPLKAPVRTIDDRVRAPMTSSAAGLNANFDDSEDEEDVIVLGSRRRRLHKNTSQTKAAEVKPDVTSRLGVNSRSPSPDSASEALSPARRSASAVDEPGPMIPDARAAVSRTAAGDVASDSDDENVLVLNSHSRRSLRKNAMRNRSGETASSVLAAGVATPSAPPESTALESAPARPAITSSEVLSSLFGELSDSDGEAQVAAKAPSLPRSGVEDPLSDSSEDERAGRNGDPGAVDSDGNDLAEPPPPTLGQKLKALTKKEKLELKKETERLLRSSAVEAPKRQSKFTVDKFLAERGIKRNAPQPTIVPNIKVKADKIVSRSELRAIAESNAAISRGDVYGDGGSSDDDVLEIFEVQEDPRKPIHKKDAWNQQLIRKNNEQTRIRRKEEEEAMRLAAEERERRKEEKRAERQAQKEADDKLAREGGATAAKTQDGGVVNLDDNAMMVDSPSPLSPQNAVEDVGKTNENNVVNSPVPPMRRLFSEDRIPFEEIYRREDAEADDMMMTSEKVRGGGSHSASSDDEEMGLLLSSPPQPINLKYSLSMGDLDNTQEMLDSMASPDIHSGDENDDASPNPFVNATAPKPQSRVQKMKSKDAAAPVLASIFNKRPPSKLLQPQSPTADIGNDDELMGMLSGKFDSTGQSAAAQSTEDEHPRFASIFGNSIDKAAATAVPGAERVLAELERGGGSTEDFRAGDDLLGMLSGKFDSTGEKPSKTLPAELSAEEEDDPFAALLSGDSSEEENQAARGEPSKRARRFVDTDDDDDENQKPQPRLPAIVRTIPPRVIQEGDDDDRESVASSQITDEEIPESQDAEDAAASKPESRATKEAAQQNRALSALIAQPPPQEKNIYVETEAFEEEDEFFGLGGADGEKDADHDAALDKDLQDLVVSDDSEVEGLNEVLELHRKQAQEAHEKGITELLNDVTTGNLRKRKARRNRNGGAGAGFMDDSDEDDDLLLAKIRGKHLALGKNGAVEEEDTPGLNAMASNPETQAFAKCFENTCGIKEGFLSSDEDVTASAPAALRTYGRRQKPTDQVTRPEDPQEPQKAKHAKLHRLRSWPTDRPSIATESSDDESQSVATNSLGADDDLLMEVDRQGVDALKIMQERRRTLAGGMVGEHRTTTLSRSHDSMRIFKKRSFLENPADSSATSPKKKKYRQSSTSSGSGFGSLDKSSDGMASGRRGMGFKIGVAPPLAPPVYASLPSFSGDKPAHLSNEALASRSTKAKRKAAEEHAAATKLTGFLSRQTSFR
ncbi:hypothetical protein HDU88_006694 [Geranomyces variabilis]|nr:hypothetical protein HDU88_006694 [Geranomyces variabilis]